MKRLALAFVSRRYSKTATEIALRFPPYGTSRFARLQRAFQSRQDIAPTTKYKCQIFAGVSTRSILKLPSRSLEATVD